MRRRYLFRWLFLALPIQKEQILETLQSAPFLTLVAKHIIRRSLPSHSRVEPEEILGARVAVPMRKRYIHLESHGCCQNVEQETNRLKLVVVEPFGACKPTL